MTFKFEPAKRENVPLLIGLAGGTGSGKTLSAMLLAKGLAGGQRFAVIDTEAGRAKHYADMFDFDHGDLNPPFRPEAYAAAIAAADSAGYPVIVVDSASHEHAGEGGLLDWHEELLDQMAKGDWKKREALTFAAWVKPKMHHKQFVSRLLQIRAHLILCFRAEEKIEIVKENGKTVVKPKTTKTGLDGWVPISEKNLPYELTLSFLLTADQPGVPKPIKLQQQHREFFPAGTPIGEEAGVQLAAWAAGGAAPKPRSRKPAEPEPTPAVEFAPATETQPDPASLSEQQFTRLYNEHKAVISAEDVNGAVKRLFGGKAYGALTDSERAQLWDAVKPTAAEDSQFRIPEGVGAEA